MKKYTFLAKPALFIFNLVFVTWLVLKIEKLQPSDFGRYGSFFEDNRPKPVMIDKAYLKRLFHNYRSGSLDSLSLEQKIDQIFTAPRPRSR